MKPIYLKMTAFGSYCNTAEVDFTRLYDNGIFLITGKTGGGKTTILDAVCMALYGKATGSERAKEWRQMRCSNAPNTVDTELEYIFSIDKTKYKFYRRWHVPNTRSGDFRVDSSENACYICREGSETWEPIATGKSKSVDDAAESILKLTQTQFVKVIMLPQGEFRELLTASSDEKEAIFKKLFDTERWEEITVRASEEFRRLDAECKNRGERRNMALKNAGCETSEELEKKISQYENQLNELKTQAEQNAKKAEQAAATLKTAEETNALFQALEQQKSELEKLNTYAEKYAKDEQKLNYSRKLRGVLPQFKLMTAAQTAVKTAFSALNSAEANEKKAKLKLTEAQKQAEEIPALEDKKKRILIDLANFSALAENRADYDTASNSLEKTKKELKITEEGLKKSQQSKLELEAKIAKGNEYLENCYAASEQLNAANEKYRALNELYTGISELETKNKRIKILAQIIAEKQKEIETEEKTLNSLEYIAKSVENAIRKDEAFSLSVGLEDGSPCPVCGSTHHPHPAQPAESTPSADELEICRKNVENSNKKLELLRNDYSKYSAEKDVLKQDANLLIQKYKKDLNQSSEEIRVELDSEKERVSQLQKRSGQTVSARERLKLRNDELTAISKDIENRILDINNLNIKISSDEQTVNSIVQRLKLQGISNFDDLDKKIRLCNSTLSQTETSIKTLNTAITAAAAAHSGALASLQAAETNKNHAESELLSRQTEFLNKCKEIGISEQTDIAAHIITEQAEADYEAQINTYRRNTSFAQKRIDELTLQLDGKEKPDTEVLRAANSAAVNKGHEIAQAIGTTSVQLKNLTDAADTIRCEDELLEKLSKDYETARRLNQLFSGLNESRTPIHQYVIGIKMDEVIMSANLYLHKLTKGQYSMKRKQSIGGRAKHQGLDIEILDSNAGRVRAVSTLSGGELFLASLSLAFGLSDVVQSFAGGIHLDSLFIDEGFGSLDSETLDTAMEAIAQVRENKLLGIISHVYELKERIPCGVEVIKTQDGSSLKMRT